MLKKAMLKNPWQSKYNLRTFLSLVKEDGFLDSLIKEYVSSILDHQIINSPSKGPYGEQGKDIVALESPNLGHYCSYVIKKGTLQENLDTKYGILYQMREALLIDLDYKQYQNKRRTVVVVHNGDEGYRGAIDRFERERINLENEIDESLLLRSIERWDIEILTEKLFPHADVFINNEIVKMYNESLVEYKDAAKDLLLLEETISKDINLDDTTKYKILSDKIVSIKKIKDKYSF